MSIEEDPRRFEPATKMKNVNVKPNLIPPQQFQSVHVDKAMVAIDQQNQTATITLLSMHVVPKISEGWELDNITWDIVGEIKIPIPSMNALAIYYLSQISGVNVMTLIQDYLKKKPVTQAANLGLSYGPTDVFQIKDEKK